jgi:hypothetical protein
VTGVVDLALTRISTDGTATVDNIQDVLTTLTLTNSGEDTDQVVISFDDDVLVGTADSLAATVSGVDVDSLEIDGEDGEGYETINMAATGDIISDDNLIDSTQTLNITGAGDATLGGFSLSAGHLATIDASGSTGNMDIELGDDNIVEARVSGSSGADIDFTYTGSAGNDYIRVDDESLTSGPTGGDDVNGHDTIDGGAGDNTLDFTVNTTRDLVHNDVTISNMQDVHIDITAAVTADLDGQQFGEVAGSADVDTITVRNNIAAAGIADFDLNDLDAGVLVRVQHSSADANDDVGDTDVYIHQMDGSGTADTQAVEIISGTNTSETFDFTLNIQANDADAADVDDAEVESITITDSDTENNIVTLSSVAEHDGTVTLTGGRADDTFTVNGSIIATTLNASGQLSDTTVTVGTADQDITMGSGDDTIIFEATDDLDENDVDIDGGTGADVIQAAFDADPADDLDITGVETIRMAFITDTAADNAVTIDVTNSDDIATVQLMSDDSSTAEYGVATVAADVITLEADGISTVNLRGLVADGTGTEIFNGLTISAFETGSPSALTISMNNIGNDAATVGVITLDADVTALTIASANDDETAATTFNEISATGLTSVTITDAVTDADGVATRENVIDLDDTTSLVTVDASGAIGGVSLALDGLADAATINLLQVDDNDDDARDDLSITFVGDTGADDVTITGGDDIEEITITNGDLDDLSINTAGGNDVINLTGATGDNIEITTGAGNDTVTGTADDEEYNLGAGNDIFNQSGGGDQIVTGAGTDEYNLDAFTTTGDDVITDFTVGTDNIDVNVTLVDQATAANALVYQAGAANTVIAGTTTVFELTGVATGGTAANLVTALGTSATNTTIDAGDTFLIANYLTGGGAQIWSFVDADGASVAAGELTLQLTLNDVAADALVTGDFI